MRRTNPICLLLLLAMSTGCTKNDSATQALLNYGPGYYATELPPSEKYKEYTENPFLKVTENPLSTFAVDADGAAYSNMRRFLNLGQRPPKAAVRIEEYINYFTFNYAEPAAGETIALNSEVSACPWNPDHHLIRIGMKGKTLNAETLPHSNYVFLIDVSGSMAAPDKLGVLKSGFKLLADGLLANDRVAIVTYAGNAGLLLDATSGSEKEKIKAAIDKLGAGGATAGAEGIHTAYAIAEKNFVPNGNNRIILGSDGDFNVGISNTDELVELIETKRNKGIYLTVLGVGGGNLNDHMMEQIANKGNGNYEYIDNVRQLQKVFVFEKSKFYTVAKDAKIQVRFNPEAVDAYRLIGYENRSLKNEDFDNEKTDAGEIGSGQTITAVYEVVLKTRVANTRLADFNLKYKLPGTGNDRPLTHEVQLTPATISRPSADTRFATAVAAMGLLMKESAYKGAVTKQLILDLATGAQGFDPNGFRKEFIELVKTIQ